MRYDYGLWWLVAIHIAGLAVFVVAFLRPIRRREWRSLGVLVGFVVALSCAIAPARGCPAASDARPLVAGDRMDR